MTAVNDFQLVSDRVVMGATISECGLYRPLLWRIWDQSKPAMVMAMLNPSTADGEEDDRTIGRGIWFAKREDCGGLFVVNMSAFRSTDPKVLQPCHFGAGGNNKVLNDTLACVAYFGGKVVVGYGAHPIADETADWFVARARFLGVPLWCLGRTKAGYPRHPLYIKGDKPLERFA